MDQPLGKITSAAQKCIDKPDPSHGNDLVSRGAVSCLLQEYLNSSKTPKELERVVSIENVTLRMDDPYQRAKEIGKASEAPLTVASSSDVALYQRFKQFADSPPVVPQMSPKGAEEPTLGDLRVFVNKSFTAAGVSASIRHGAGKKLCVEASATLAFELSQRNFNYYRVAMAGELPKGVINQLKKIGADMDSMNITPHWYLLVKTKDHGVVVVDPTICQFFKGGGIDSNGNAISREGLPFVGKPSAIKKAFDQNHARRDSENLMLGSQVAESGQDLYTTIYGDARIPEYPTEKMRSISLTRQEKDVLRKLSECINWYHNSASHRRKPVEH